jgi:hypothetical protein
MTVTLIEGIAAVLMYLFGGALVLFIYEAYVKTRQKNLIYMAIGFFILIFGGNLTTLVEAMQAQTWWPTAFVASDARTLSLVIQLIGILLLLLSVMRPFGRKE